MNDPAHLFQVSAVHTVSAENRQMLIGAAPTGQFALMRERTRRPIVSVGLGAHVHLRVDRRGTVLASYTPSLGIYAA